MADGAGRIGFEVYGLRIAVEGEWPEVLEAVGDDFAWFAREDVPDPAVVVRVERRPPDFDALGPVAASFVTPRNVVYQNGTRTLVDYFGKAAAHIDRERGTVTVQGESEQLVHEATYLYLLSRIGEHLDQRGFTRLHGLGLAGSQGGVVLMLPSGGGKTRMALTALRSDTVRLLSEDTPLIDRKGLLHPFPLRIGVNETDADALPEGPVRRLERMEFHPKLLLSLKAFGDRIESRPQPLRHLVIGQRTLGHEATLTPLPRRAAFGPLVREAVVGVGVYQGMEFVLQRGMRDVAGKIGVATGRLRRCNASLHHAQVWRLRLGRDFEQNWDVLAQLL